MELVVQADPQAAAQQAAAVIAHEARAAIAARGRFVMAVSGGRTPGLMLRALAAEPLAWGSVHIFQVDERVAPEGHPDRNLTDLREALRANPVHFHPMPVEAADTAAYAATLQSFAGSPPVLDLVHLGLGADGHTASLVPGDAVLWVLDFDVAMTGEYQGRRRMTLTYPALDRARRVLWLVTGGEKAPMLERLMGADPSIPAGKVRQDEAVIVADRAAAAMVRGPS